MVLRAKCWTGMPVWIQFLYNRLPAWAEAGYLAAPCLGFPSGRPGVTPGVSSDGEPLVCPCAVTSTVGLRYWLGP